MNSITIRSDEVWNDAAVERFADSLRTFFDASMRIVDWRREEGRRRVDSAGFADRDLVSFDDIPDLRGDRNAFLKRSQR